MKSPWTSKAEKAYLSPSDKRRRIAGGFVLNIQIFGKSKCFDTAKAERYFKERRIKYQFVDILRYGLSKGELESVARAVGIDRLIDSRSKDYGRLGLAGIVSPAARRELLLENPGLYRTPIVRNGKAATVGY